MDLYVLYVRAQKLKKMNELKVHFKDTKLFQKSNY